jgi:hypothetical protein
VKSVKEAISASTPALAKLRKEHGILAQLIVEARIVWAMGMVRAGKRHTEQQIPDIAELILERYYYFKPEDIFLCFKRGVAGDYGNTYDVLDASTYLAWCAQYAEQRLSEGEKMSNNARKEAQKSSELTEVMQSGVIKKIIDELPKNEAPVQPEPERIKMSKFELVIHRGYSRLPVEGGFKRYKQHLVDWSLYLALRTQKILQRFAQ